MHDACCYHTPVVPPVDLDTPATVQPLLLMMPLLDDALKQQVWDWLARDLPTLAKPAPDPIANQMVVATAAIRQELALACLAADAACAEACAPKTMTEAYPTLAMVLTGCAPLTLMMSSHHSGSSMPPW